MKELLEVWGIEAVAIGCFLMPLALTVHGIGQLREDRRQRERRRSNEGGTDGE